MPPHAKPQDASSADTFLPGKMRAIIHAVLAARRASEQADTAAQVAHVAYAEAQETLADLQERSGLGTFTDNESGVTFVPTLSTYVGWDAEVYPQLEDDTPETLPERAQRRAELKAQLLDFLQQVDSYEDGVEEQYIKWQSLRGENHYKRWVKEGVIIPEFVRPSHRPGLTMRGYKQWAANQTG